MLRYTFLIALLLLASNVVAQNSIPQYESNPGANLTIYLDFNGHTTTTRYWTASNDNQPIVTPAFSLDEDVDSFSERELTVIHNIWARVAEDYAPFNVNVTTRIDDENTGDETRTGYENSLLRTDVSDATYGVRAVIGGDSTWYSAGVGGVAHLDSFDSVENSYYGPAFVFPANLPIGGTPSEKFVAEAISHEVGHNLGLIHDGTLAPNGVEYYQGKDGWAPIMGNSYYQGVTQWDKGEYGDAINYSRNEPVTDEPIQDDLTILASKLEYRQDDFAGVNKGANGIVNGTITMLTDPEYRVGGEDPLRNYFSVNGFIETNTDVDMFQFTLGEGGDFGFEVDSGIWHDTDANLDVLAKLYDADTGKLLWTWDPTNVLNTMGIAMVTLSDILGIVEMGTYYLSLEGTGRSVWEGEGDAREEIVYYTDYASIGTWNLSGWIIEGALPVSTVPEPATLAMLGLGLAGLGLVARRRRK